MKYYKELLTIGIPAYNEEKYIAHTIESCIEQAGTVIISDNASTDNTQKICEELAKKYPNLIYVRQKENFGGATNFNFLLNAAKTKYFMWMGSHDYLKVESTKHMIYALENSNAVGCCPLYSPVDIDGYEIAIFEPHYRYKMCSDYQAERVYTAIRHLHDVCELFGIYRAEIAKKYPLISAIGNDHIFVTNMAFNGKILYSSNAIYHARQTKLGLSYEKNLEIWQKSLVGKNEKINLSQKIMQKEQLKILKKSSSKGYGLFGKIYLNYKAKKKLNKTFYE